ESVGEVRFQHVSAFRELCTSPAEVPEVLESILDLPAKHAEHVLRLLFLGLRRDKFEYGDQRSQGQVLIDRPAGDSVEHITPMLMGIITWFEGNIVQVRSNSNAGKTPPLFEGPDYFGILVICRQCPHRGP